MPGAVRQDGLSRPSLGLVPPRRESLGAKSKWAARQGIPTLRGSLPSAPRHTHRPGQRSRTFTRSGAARYSPAYWTSVCASRTTAAKLQLLRSSHASSSALLPDQPLLGKWWQGELAAAAAVASAIPASSAGHHSGPRVTHTHTATLPPTLITLIAPR